MIRTFAAAIFACICAVAQAQSDILVEVERPRIASGTPVVQRAILVKPAGPSDTALLFFRGVPGYALIQSTADRFRNLPGFLRLMERRLLDAGIAVVVMDCPTDQWGSRGDYLPTNCFDRYRSSKEHADDVRSVMAKLKEQGFTKFYVMGHSMGTISSRWLARNLGNEIAGSIHSASHNVPSPKGRYGDSMSGFAYDSIKTPILHVHHEQDACRGTPFAIVQGYARDNLLAITSGTPTGDPCRITHLHSYQGAEETVTKGVIDWIRTGRIAR